ncbi:hypothetical protein GCM10022631_11550 [Deinococcus rubellus]|uniref:Uncharacterized protein n=1 Tax=Deinococcus rubellus TaxID=1889240 RepID=A0ABY5YD85_9DEIO|nr:hypothetical protein [Deinococcus rubellus]UWX62800.1 hypothetical protein N0D28_08435 [Deinococcus rubellus]
MNELLNLITGMVGDKLSVATVLKLAPVLAPVVIDLADGDAHLSAENRLKVQEEIEKLREMGEL